MNTERQLSLFARLRLVRAPPERHGLLDLAV